MYSFFKKKRCRDQDAEDLASDLILKFLKRMENFPFDPGCSFRSYLHKAARNAVNELRKKLAKEKTLHEKLAKDLDQVLTPLKEQLDRDLLEEAERQVRDQVSERDWEIYLELTKKTATPEELAKKLGISRDAVDTAKWRVKNRLKTAVRNLKPWGPEEG